MTTLALFGTSGIRGSAETLFTPGFCRDIGRTFAEFLKRRGYGGPVVIGMDPRESSPRIKSDLIVGLASLGSEIYDQGITPIPSVNWMIKTTPAKAGVMITGSHIAPELNGLKFYAHEEEISVPDEVEIEDIYKSVKGKDVAPVRATIIEETKARELYSEMLLGLAKRGLPKWKVAVDCANGSQSVVMPALLEKLGQEVIKVNCEPGKNFIARDTDTDDQAKLEDLKKAVTDGSCDFGVAYDGDGDRVVFIDELGNFIQGEYSCGLIARESSEETIVTTVSASEVVEELGKKVVRTKVGSPYIIEGMKLSHAKFGFEPNGGAVSGEIMYTRDGGSMTVKILNLLAAKKMKFSGLVATLPKFYMARTKVQYKWEMKDKIIAGAKATFKGIKVDETDGLKIWLDDVSWILFRSSANAPEFRVFAESRDEATAKKLLTDGVNFVNGIIHNG